MINKIFYVTLLFFVLSAASARASMNYQLFLDFSSTNIETFSIQPENENAKLKRVVTNYNYELLDTTLNIVGNRDFI